MLAFPEKGLGRFSQRIIGHSSRFGLSGNQFSISGIVAQKKADDKFSSYLGAKDLYSASVAAGMTSASIAETTKGLVPWLYVGPPATCWGMNPIKGAFTEQVMQRALLSGSFEATRWAVVTPNRVGNQGIDGIFFRTDYHGNLRNLMVAEAKFGTSKLNKTTTGLQMSSGWTRPRLEQTARDYDRLASEIQKTSVRQTKLHAPRGAKAIGVPWKNGRTINIWRDEGFLVYNAMDPNVTPQVIAQQAKRVGITLHAAASGRFEYRSSLVRVDVSDGKFIFEVQRIDPINAKAIGKSSRIQFNPRMRNITASSLDKALVENGFSREDARALAQRCLNDPEFFKMMNREPRMNWKLGLNWQAVGVAALAGSFVFVGSTLFCLLKGEHVEWKKISCSAMLIAGSTFIGQYLGTQMASALIVTELGSRLAMVLPLRALGVARLAGSIGGFAGGIITSGLISYGAWLLGWCDLSTANRSMTAGVVGSIGGISFFFGAQATVAAFGVASTGTAISTLSGAAAANATMAWFGGGAVAAGGGGIALGTIVVTVGAAAVLIGIGAGVYAGFRYLDARERKLLLLGRIELVSQRVSKGLQAEWQPSAG